MPETFEFNVEEMQRGKEGNQQLLGSKIRYCSKAQCGGYMCVRQRQGWGQGQRERNCGPA